MKLKRIFSSFLIVCMVISVLPTGVLITSAADIRQAEKADYSVKIGNQVIPFSDYPDGSYFTDDGQKCGKLHRKHDERYCYDLEEYCNCKCTYNGVKLQSMQCLAFAHHVFYRLFGVLDRGSNPGFYSVQGSSVWLKNLNADVLKNLLLYNSKPGAHIRTGPSIEWTGEGHSMILMSCDENSITIYDANSQGLCDVRVKTFTWQEFYLDQFKGRGRSLCFIHMPNNYPGAIQVTNAESKPQSVTPSYNQINTFPLPIICYTESTNGAQTFFGSITSFNRGHIGASTQCEIKEIYGNGRVLVKYDGKEAYAMKSSFMLGEGAIKEARVAYNQPVYTRSNLSQSIGTVYKTDSIKIVYEGRDVAQIIYPTSYGFKMGWIRKSNLIYGDNVGGGSSSYTAVEGVPQNIKSYTLRSGQITTYDNANGNKIGWIDGAVDLCTIKQVYTNNWLKANYPIPGGTKNGWTPSTEFADSFTIKRTTKAISNQPVYTTSAMTKKIGDVYANDNVLIVGESGSKLQIIYPISGGFKMGWIEASKLESQVKSVEVKTTPTKTTYVQGEKLNTSGLSVVTNYIGGAFKWIGRKLGVMDDEEGYELRNTDLDSVGTHTIAIEYEENGVMKTDSFNVEVIPREITSISISKKPNKLTYIEGEKFDDSGLEVVATFNDNTTEIITNYEVEIADSLPGIKTAYVIRGDAVTTFQLTVKAKELEGIALKSKPNKTTYAEGQSLDTTGLKLIASYNNDTSEEITSGFTCSSIDTSYIGKQTVTVSYKGKTTTFPIEVIQKQPSSIEIVSNPTKTDVLEGIIDLDTTGMKVKIFYDNGSSETIETGFNIVGYEPRTLGKQTITVNYCGFTDTFDINVKAKTLTELKIAEPASVTEFIEGEEFESYGLVVHGYYDNGDINEISDYTISGYDNTVGTKKITISYGGKTTSYTVNVSQKEIKHIEVKTAPTKTEYLEDEELDTTGLEIIAVYNNGDKEPITLSECSISGYDNIPGRKAISVVYGDYTTSFDVTVKEMSLSSFEITNKPTKMAYNVGEELDLSGLELTAKYAHGATETVDINDCVVSGFNKDVAGIQVVLITYRGSSVAFIANVKQIIEQTAMIRTGKVSATNGSTVVVPVNVINNTGISDIELTVNYDKNAFSNVDIKSSELLNNGTFEVGVLTESDDFITHKITWSSDEDLKKNGTLFNMYFTVKQDAVSGTYPLEISYNTETTKNKEGKAVKLSCVDGSVDVAVGETIPYVISGEQATVQSGGLLNYEISLANNVGLSSYKLKVLYDTTALDINAVKSGRLFGDFAVDYTEIDGGIEITGTSEGLNKQNGSFLTLEFTAAEGIENATYPISITCTENGNDATIECEEGSVAISGYVLGDINGDGRVNNFDVMMHVGYLSGSQKLTPEQLMAADVTGDGNVDYLDYSSISSYVVGIYEGLNSDVETMGSSLSYASNFVGGANSERAVITASEIFDAEPGEYVTVDVDLSRNPGLSGYVVTMEYDTESLELIDIVQKDALSGGKFNTNTSVAGEATVMWSDIETHNENGTIFSVTFKVGNDVPEELPLILTYNSEHTGYLNETNNSVPVSLMSEDGAIYIDTESAYMTLDNVTNDGTNISGIINIYNDAEFEGSADLLIVTYDEIGRMISMKSQTVELIANETSSLYISISAKEAKTLKAIILEKGSIRPLMNFKSKTF